MKKLIYIVVIYLIFISGCSKRETEVFGLWQGDTLKMEFFDDNTGMLIPTSGTLEGGQKSLKFTWKFLKDGKVKIDTGRDDFIVFEIKDKQLEATVSGAKFTKAR